MTNTIKPSAQETPEKTQEIETAPESELSDDALDQVSGGLKRLARGPGTQTEDDVYVG